MFTWKLCPLFVKHSVNFFPTRLLLTFCWELDTKYGRKIARTGDWCRLKGLSRRPSAAHMSHVLKKVAARFDPNNGWFPMWSMPTDHFPILRNLIISVGLGTWRLVYLVFAKWLFIMLNYLVMFTNDAWCLTKTLQTRIVMMMMMMMMIMCTNRIRVGLIQLS